MPLSTTQYGYIIDPLVPLTDDTGRTISNGYVRVFMAGTSTPVITYKNFDGATNEETVQLDNSGRTAYPVIGSKGSTYKVCVYDSEHSQETPIKTIDKVVPIGASVSATNIVTGLDNVESPEAGWVKSTVSGTDAEVSLDATNVTSEVDTMVKATAASADYMMPLVHKAGSDPDKKITLGNIFKFVLNFIHSLTDTATEADLVAGNYFALDGSAGTKKLNSTTLLTKTAQNALAGNVAPAFDETGETDYTAGTPIVRGGKTFVFKVDHSGVWSSSDVEEVDERKIFMLKKDFNENFVCKSGFVVEKLNGYYSTPNSSGVSTFTSSRQYLSVKFKVDELAKYSVFCEKGFTSNNPKLIFVDGDGKFFVNSNLVSSVVDNSFSFINNSAKYAIVQMSTTMYESTLYRLEKVVDLSETLLDTPFNMVGPVEAGSWAASSGSVVGDADLRYVRAKLTLKPFTTYKIDFFMAGSSPRVALCLNGSSQILKYWGYSSTSDEFSTQAYPMDLYICTRIFQGTDFDAVNKISVVEQSVQNEFKPLCDWTNDSTNMFAGWYKNTLVLDGESNDISGSWEQSYFSHSAPIPVTPGQWEFKGQGVQTSNMIVMKSDALGNPSRDFYVNGLGLGNNTPFKKVFNIPAGVDYVIVQGVCCNGKANSNFYLRKLSEDVSSNSVFKAVTYGKVVVHTKDVRTVADNVVVDDDGSTDEDCFVVMYPEKIVAGKRKLVVMFHGAGEPVNASSWRGLEVPMASFFTAMGYVVCACNGMPSAFATAHNLSYARPVGNYMWIESACKMVEKVCREYDCDPNEIYVYGESQGGMGALNFVECSGVKVKACVVDSPAISMRYSQLNIAGALDNMLYFYGFNSDAGYSPDKVYGLDPYGRNCNKIEDKNDYTIQSNVISAEELENVVSKRTICAPTKFFLGTADTTTPAYASQIVYKQLKNAGQMVACNLYQGVTHCTDQNSEVIGTFEYRGTTFNVTQPIVDMVNWWARFGGYDELPEIT